MAKIKLRFGENEIEIESRDFYVDNNTIGEVINSLFCLAQAVIILITPDEFVKLKEIYLKDDDTEEEKKGSYQPRPNVIFEAGFALGIMENRTIIVQIGQTRSPSDIFGRHVIKFDGSIEKREALINRLEIVGCHVKKTRRKWKTVGNFSKE